MKKYTYYKPVDSIFLKEIPEGWNFNKLSRICYMKGRIGWQGLKQSEFTTEGPYLITGMNFKDGKIRWNEVYHITEARYDEAPEIQLKVGDVLMTKDGTIGKLLYVDTLPDKTSLNSHLLVLRPLNNDFQPKYLYYLLQSEVFKTHIELNKTGTTFYGISQEAVGRFKMILPPLKEQDVLVSYLDYKLSKIDELMFKKQKLIDLLKEERASIINQAVTKGINPDVEMKDSGIEWLGKIPKGWEKIKLKYLVKNKITDGPHETPEFIENGIPFISAEAIKNNKVDFDARRGDISQELFERYTQKCSVQKEDILFCKAGATTGKSALIETDEVFTIWSPLAIIRADIKKTLPHFLFKAIQSNMFQKQVETSWSFGTQPNIGMNVIENLWIIVPPLREQETIISLLYNRIEKIEKTIQKISKEIDLLQEYLTALISEVVTGKIDVRDEVVL